ncbi:MULTISPECIES: type II toxin-antitoxin system Phd/YefM family antitoxin [unclassified Pseudofrankia]|uniref:type II toxin-antitoxin system Phd/YefM family antitoxin n=1 Tax=unclassified Pseudofrankia TaxID=2994372 RepID=UPI0008D948AA|nr:MULTISPECIES: type II toxin-antitoxin system prevent-host-death family antitoxin [unclassified Pseudofrankia]MDT3440422.1 type II toxin-antitoxin system prevent-host-death family antitoxin [Pseudofrankia sp. BMG5.37]OHV47568.1 prevent-host-death family protein [Pseudofrankia sp. BMG5.36]
MASPALDLDDDDDDDEHSVGIRDLSHHTSQVLGRVRAGERIVITDRGEPVAMMVPLRRSTWIRPAAGYVNSGDPGWAAQAAEELTGFGE